uniref:Primase n=1 Tax=Gonatozygon brebissonii TaxID=184482 RepID=A0A6G9IF03_9VIRI|nr:primase [Gonatozygon brebissonii]QIQ23040.1 primase [Gonatozygon brebissonii]
MSDVEYYRGDLAILKMLTGGDALKGRQKLVQGSSEIVVNGLVMIVSNYPLGSLDTSNAIARRMRVFPVENVPKEIREDLLI